MFPRKPISGYVLVLEFLDKKRQASGKGMATNVYDPSFAERPVMIPGQTATEQIQLPPDSVGIPKLSIDYVQFADRSEWGPDTERQSLLIQGMLQGSRLTRHQLKKMLKDKGPDAVLKELNQ
jgi:hypothetical protein